MEWKPEVYIKTMSLRRMTNIMTRTRPMKQLLSASFYKKVTGQFMCHVNTMSKYPGGYLGWHIKELEVLSFFGNRNASLASSVESMKGLNFILDCHQSVRKVGKELGMLHMLKNNSLQTFHCDSHTLFILISFHISHSACEHCTI